MKIAIAGGTGTIGRLITEAARHRGHEAVVLARSTREPTSQPGRVLIGARWR